MVYFAIFIIPFFYLFNGFCIGITLKRINKLLNSYFLTITGLLIFLGLFQVVFIFLYLASSSIIIYLCFIGAIQIILLIYYAFNIKYFFYLKPNKKIIFFITCFFVSLIFFVVINFSNPNFILKSSFGIKIFNFLLTNDFDIFKIINFNDYFANEFSSFNLFTIIFSNVLRITGENDAIIFFRWGYTILFSFIISCIFSMIYINKTKNIFLYYSTVIFIEILFMFFCFLNFESPIICTTWLPLMIAYFWYILFKKNNLIQNQLIYFSWIALFSFTTFSELGILFSISLAFFSFYYLSIKNNNVFDFLIGMLLILTFQLVNVFNVLDQSSLLIIFEGIIILSFLFFLLIKKKFLSYKIKSLIVNLIYTNIHSVFFLLLTTIYLISIYQIVNYGNLIDFYIFKYEYIWFLTLTENPLLILNITLWATYCVSIIISCIYLLIKKIKISLGYSLIFIVFNILFFINPLSLHLFGMLFGRFNDNLSILNYLLLIPISLELNVMFNNKKKSTSFYTISTSVYE